MSPRIRLAGEDDAEEIRAIYAPFCAEMSPVSFEIRPPTVDEMRGRILRTLERYPWLVCERGGAILGYVYAGAHSERAAYAWSVNVSVYVEATRRRSGIGRALYTSLFNALRLLGYYNAYAGITLPNPGSVGIHRAMGFEPVGVYRGVGHKGGAWHDVGWWQLALRERGPGPEAPAGLRDGPRRAGWLPALASGLSFLRVS